jgi:hypothetical protein
MLYFIWQVQICKMYPWPLNLYLENLTRESDTRFSTSGFFHETVSPWPQVFHCGPYEFFRKLTGSGENCFMKKT